jgi:hypothetical protein
MNQVRFGTIQARIYRNTGPRLTMEASLRMGKGHIIRVKSA